MIDGKINVTLSIDDVNYYNELEERDKAKPITTSTIEYEDEGEKKSYTIEYCPICGATVGTCKVFCDDCGQRLDKENIAL